MSEDFPRQIGRYEVITLLGEGGMARAYLAVSHGPGGFNKLAVIKQILPKLARDAEFVAMFLDEARLAARLHHPNIVQTFDVVEHRGSYVLAMEYLEGVSLSAIYKRIHPRLLPVETHLWVLVQVLAGLHYAHTLCDYDGTPLGVVHRDVNPANILVTYAGDVKLLDFGVAKARGAMASSTERSIRGKPAYCAPEQLRGLEPDARADVFAVGVMLWEVLAGRRFNRGRSLVEAAKIRLSGREPMIREVCPSVDPTLADICDRALAVEPSHRFASAAEFRMELQVHLEKRNGLDRRIMVERLDEVFAADRNELRKLIETCLADTTVRESVGALAETEQTGEQTRPLGPTPSPASGSAGWSGWKNRARLLLAWRPRILVGVAVVVSAVLSGTLVFSLRGPSGQNRQKGSDTEASRERPSRQAPKALARQTSKASTSQTPKEPAPQAPVAAVPQAATAPVPQDLPSTQAVATSAPQALTASAPQAATASTVPSPSDDVPGVEPAAIAPEPKVNRAANAASPARLAGKIVPIPRVELRAPVTKPRPVRSHKKTAHSSPARRPIQRIVEVPVSVPNPDKPPVPPPEDASASQPAARRSPPSDQPASAVQPGTHLQRRSTPVHNSVDEKDPYSP